MTKKLELVQGLTIFIIIMFFIMLLVNPLILKYINILFFVSMFGNVYLYLLANGNIKRFVKWWKDGILKARVRKRERDEFIKSYRDKYNYKL
jgi:multisubunit Na+/H+ antiporter MnhG subunit